MDILVIGGTGTLGQAIYKELSPRHSLIIASYKRGDELVDIRDVNSIEKLFKKIKTVDAVICATGTVHFDEFMKMTEKEYAIGLENKLMGQVNVVLVGRHYVKDQGSFTLTSGILSHDPIRYGSSASMVNGALDSFVKAAAIEMPKGQRINCVSPTVLKESLPAYAPYFHGYKPVAASEVALAFAKSVEGAQTGQIYDVGG